MTLRATWNGTVLAESDDALAGGCSVTDSGSRPYPVTSNSVTGCAPSRFPVDERPSPSPTRWRSATCCTTAFATAVVILLVPTNVSSYGPHSPIARQELLEAQARALEERMWLVQAGPSGITAIVDASGTRAPTDPAVRACDCPRQRANRNHPDTLRTRRRHTDHRSRALGAPGRAPASQTGPRSARVRGRRSTAPARGTRVLRRRKQHDQGIESQA